MEGEIAGGREVGLRCLVGKLWAEKPVNGEAFKTVMSRVWRMAGTVVFKELQDNLWLFEFEEEEEKRRVMVGRPWSFDRQILVLNEFDGQCPPSQMVFMKSPFWIQIHDMPLLCMTKGIGTKIAASLGDLEEVDVAGDGAGWGRCLRIRVTIDLSNPLERGRDLMVGGKPFWVFFKYEKLPMVCFHCGRVIHGKKGCPEVMKKQMKMGDGDKQWGTWLRADLPKRQGNSSQGNGRNGNGGEDSFSGKGAASGSKREERNKENSYGCEKIPKSHTKTDCEGKSADSVFCDIGGGKKDYNMKGSGIVNKVDGGGVIMGEEVVENSLLEEPTKQNLINLERDTTCMDDMQATGLIQSDHIVEVMSDVETYGEGGKKGSEKSMVKECGGRLNMKLWKRRARGSTLCNEKGGVAVEVGSRRKAQTDIGGSKQPGKKRKEKNIDSDFWPGINELAEAAEQSRQPQ